MMRNAGIKMASGGRNSRTASPSACAVFTVVILFTCPQTAICLFPCPASSLISCSFIVICIIRIHVNFECLSISPTIPIYRSASHTMTSDRFSKMCRWDAWYRRRCTVSKNRHGNRSAMWTLRSRDPAGRKTIFCNTEGRSPGRST